MRYQFMPRAHVAQIDVNKAKKHARYYRAKYPREAFPIMDWGRGTNQPRTVAFSCETDDDARLIAKAYGEENAFVWNITEGRYV